MRHCDEEDWQRQSAADPQTPSHIAQFRVLFFAAGTGVFRLQRHPADRAIAWMILLDLRMHRAGIDGLSRLAIS